MLINDIRKDTKALSYFKKILFFFILLLLLDTLVAAFLLGGLNRYYGLKQHTDIALVGHSHLMLGIDKAALEEGTHQKVSKYTREGVNVADRNIMIDQLLQDNPTLKVVVYGVDAWMFTGEGLSNNSYKLFYPFMSQPDENTYINEKASFFDYWQHKLIKTSRFNELLLNATFRGYLHNWANFKFGTIDTTKFKSEIIEGKYRKINSNNANRLIFEKSLKNLLIKNIKVILLYVPTIDLYNRTEPKKFKTEINYFRNIPTAIPGVSYIELIEPLSHDYSIFFDPVHLNPKGQKIVTEQLAKELNRIY